MVGQFEDVAAKELPSSWLHPSVFAKAMAAVPEAVETRLRLLFAVQEVLKVVEADALVLVGEVSEAELEEKNEVRVFIMQIEHLFRKFKLWIGFQQVLDFGCEMVVSDFIIAFLVEQFFQPKHEVLDVEVVDFRLFNLLTPKKALEDVFGDKITVPEQFFAYVLRLDELGLLEFAQVGQEAKHVEVFVAQIGSDFRDGA